MKVIDDMKDKTYTFNHIAEMQIITLLIKWRCHTLNGKKRYDQQKQKLDRQKLIEIGDIL